MSKNRQRVKKPNAIIYLLAFLVVYPLLKVLFHLRVDRGDYHRPSGPCIVLSNHHSYMDFLLAMLTLYPRRVNTLAAYKFFLYRPLNWFLPLMGSIPKTLFEPDLKSVMAMMDVIKRGDSLLLFPEGRCTVHGPYMGIHRATGKLVKKLEVPVFTCFIESAYTCMPFWRKLFRRGPVRVRLADLFSAEETKTLSVDEINARIDARLSGADYGVTDGGSLGLFKARRLLEGLENLIYLCPRCKQEFTHETSGNTMYCKACGNTVSMNRRAELVPHEGSIAPKSVAEWYRTQIDYETQALRKGGEFLRAEVKVRMPGENSLGLQACGEGIITLDGEGWCFEGELRGAQTRLLFPIETVPAIPFDPNDNFQIYAHKKFYSFTPTGNSRAVSKYATIGECAYWYFAEKVQISSGDGRGFCRARPLRVRATSQGEGEARAV